MKPGSLNKRGIVQRQVETQNGAGEVEFVYETLFELWMAVEPIAGREMFLVKALGALEDGKVLRKVVRAAFKPTYQAALVAIPVGTVMHRTYRGRIVAPGFAKSTLKLKTSVSKDKQMARATIGVGAEAFYVMQFVELFGQYGQPPRPWLRPVFYGHRGEQQALLASGLKKEILRIAAKTGGAANVM